MGIEKKNWIEIKDLIFGTDSTVLDYLNWHCKRWRETANIHKQKKSSTTDLFICVQANKGRPI